MIRARGLVKSFGSATPPVTAPDFQIARGECLVITGADGSGKSTVLRLLATTLRPTAGTIELDGRDLHGPHSLARTGIAFADGWLDPAGELTTGEYLRLSAISSGSAARCWDAAERMELDPSTPLQQLDPRARRRLSYATALASGRELLLLDDLFDGSTADVAAAQWISELVSDGTAVALSGTLAQADDLDGRVLQLVRKCTS